MFAGLAASELGRVGEAKEHYKSAIAAQPTDQLAWKVRGNWLWCSASICVCVCVCVCACVCVCVCVGTVWPSG